MKKIAMIPARYVATRFPFKLMQELSGKTVIRHTYENTVHTGLFDEVYVVTDSEIIYNEIRLNGGNAVMSVRTHESGSDRIAEAIENLQADVVLNVQGDEPFVDKQALSALLKAFDDEKVQVASLMKQFTNKSLINDTNYVKVVVDKNFNSLYFSRSAIPFVRDENVVINFYEHIGIYAFRKNMLLRFTKWPATPLEMAEKLEQLRYLENGVQIKMIETTSSSVKIDVPEDLVKAQEFLNSLGK